MSAQGLRSVLGNQAERETRQHQSPSSRDRSVVSSALGRLFVTGSKGDCPQYKELEDLTDNAHVGAKHRREREKGEVVCRLTEARSHTVNVDRQTD